MSSTSSNLSKHVRLPLPIELAKLAAAFVPKDDDARDGYLLTHLDAAIKEAVQLYLRAERFYQKHNNDTLEKLADAIGDNQLWLEASLSRMRGGKFRLEMDKRRDTARRYLAKHGLHLKTARSVLENLETCVRFGSHPIFVQDVRQQEAKVKENMTQKEKDEAMERQALELGWDRTRWNQDVWPGVLKVCREIRPDNREVYLLDEMMLSNLVVWKKARKHSGGVKSRQTVSANKSSK